jgi:transcriptional regulator with XRE-family HTH domain
MYPTIEAEIARHKTITGEGKEVIAKRMGMSSNSFRWKLRGQREFTVTELVALAEILGINSVDKLIERADAV